MIRSIIHYQVILLEDSSSIYSVPEAVSKHETYFENCRLCPINKLIKLSQESDISELKMLKSKIRRDKVTIFSLSTTSTVILQYESQPDSLRQLRLLLKNKLCYHLQADVRNNLLMHISIKTKLIRRDS